ncbi:MAG: serine/threonine protein kinase [Chrysiogenetes bacterium]|nr:serine/threonine protein kinase [Chrysiogenetes bacterium]
MSQSAWGDPVTKYFFDLGPDRVLDAVEAAGYVTTGMCYALNSYENRVYEVEIEEDEARGIVKKTPASLRRIVKFYRPGRWSREQILEEHEFIADLVAQEIPAVAPLPFDSAETLAQVPGTELWYAIFPKVGGRVPEELGEESLHQLGRLLARLHNVGASKQAPHRVKLTPETYGLANLEYLLSEKKIPAEIEDFYAQTVREICKLSEPMFAEASYHRVHGDCHAGNLLWDGQFLKLVDFDDMVRAPAVQDLWLLLPGEGEERRLALESVLSGYEQMRPFDRATIRLIEPLRALRFIHFTAWIARRWEDPAFPPAFPHFGTGQYWNQMLRDLQEQLSLIREAAYGGY